MPARLPIVVLALLAAGCDFTPALDIETPEFRSAVVMRSVLAAGQPPTVRLSVSRDPYAEQVDDADRLPSATPAGATVTLLRDGRTVETLTGRSQTCHVSRRTACNAVTGRTDVEESGPYECGAFSGSVPIEPGATYTIRAVVPGLPPAEATVTVPHRPDVSADEEAGDAETRRFRVRVRDVPGEGSRFGLTLFREFGAFTTAVCRRGGPRDTTFVLGSPWRYQSRFETNDPLLLADAPEAVTSIPFATFSDATFRGGEAVLSIRATAVATTTTVTPTGGLQVQIAALSPTLYEAYQTASATFGEEDPFAEPADLPGNVVGGYGLVGAVSIVDVALPAR